MYRHLPVILLFSLLSVLANGQKTIVGKVLNKSTHEPIPFANIGIVNSNVGTISNMNGSFSILIPQRLIHDSLFFTSLGFYKQGLAVNSLESKKDYTIYLNERVTILQSVTISAKKIKDKDINVGNSSYYGGNYEPDTTYAGRAVALLIDGKNFPAGTSFPVYVKKAKLLILRNNFQTFKFRVRINKYDSLTGKPGEDLLEKSIVEESNMKSGWLYFDLTKSYFRAKGPFFITFEQLVDLDGRTAIALGYHDIMHFHPEWLKTDTVLIDNKKVITREFMTGGIDLPGTFIGISNSKSLIQKYTCFVRQTSLGEWTKVPLVIAATVTVSGQFGETPEESKDAPVLEIR
jgi:hypothetical protein